MADLKSKEEWFQLVCNKLQIVPEPKDVWKSPRTNMALTEYGLYLLVKSPMILALNLINRVH